MNIRPADVIDFWMGDVLGDVAHLPVAFKRWFQGGESLDRDIAARFYEAVEQALEGGLRQWEAEPQSRLALVILLDQFPRNIHRGTPRAFAGDARALAIARKDVAAGNDLAMTYAERVFLLMPFQHVEDRELQHESVALFMKLEADARASGAPEAVQEWLAGTREYAELHRDIVLQFGRFPHRNDVLGRNSTPAEQAWLDEGGQRFGQ